MGVSINMLGEGQGAELRMDKKRRVALGLERAEGRGGRTREECGIDMRARQ